MEDRVALVNLSDATSLYEGSLDSEIVMSCRSLSIARLAEQFSATLVSPSVCALFKGAAVYGERFVSNLNREA